ncbi:hypothetical protein ACLBW7_10175 [Klebsiella grimontii]
MTDITKLAQSLKRRAASANEFGEGLFFIKADDVLALLEALDNTQAENELVRGQLFIAGRTLLNQQAKIAELAMAAMNSEPAARMVVIPTIRKHYTAAKIATIYEKAMTDAGIEWRSIDD